MTSVVERTFTGGVGFLSAHLASKALGLAFILIASRCLGAAEFGIFALALSIALLIQHLGRFGLPTAIQRYLSGRGETNAEEILAAIMLVGICSGIGVSLLLYLLAPRISLHLFGTQELIPVLRVLSAGLLLALLYGLLRSILQSQEWVAWIVVGDVLRDTSKILVLLVLILFSSPSSLAAAWSVVFSSLVAVVVVAVLAMRLPLRPKFPVSRRTLNSLGSYAVPLAFVGFGYLLANQMDRLMLGALSTSSAVGVYSAVSSLALAASVMHQSLVPAFMPIASEAHRERNFRDLQSAYFFTARWVSYPSAILLMVFLGSGEWVLTIFGPDYSTIHAYYVLLILGAMNFLSGWVGPTGALLQMSGGHRLELVNTLVFIAANFGLNLMLIPVYGILGAAAATLVSGVVRNGLQVMELILVGRFFPIAAGQLGTLLPVLGAFTVAIVVGPDHPLTFAASAGAAVCMGLLFLIGLSQEERQLARRALLKLRLARQR